MCWESVSEVHISCLLRAVTAAGGRGRGVVGRGVSAKETGREGKARVMGVVIDRREEGEGKGDGWEGRRQAGGGGFEVCTRLSAPGVPCGPRSGVREG